MLVSKNFSLKKSLSIGLKKSRRLSQKFGAQKSLGIGLKNLDLKKVSVLVSKDLVSKKVSVSNEISGLVTQCRPNKLHMRDIVSIACLVNEALVAIDLRT